MQGPLHCNPGANERAEGQTSADPVERCICNLWRDVRELSLGEGPAVDILEGPPSPLQFLRGYVMPNKPCIIKGAINQWASLTMWTNDYLKNKMRQQKVSIHFTPNGRADAVTQHNGESVFVSAHVEQMPFGNALEYITSSKRDKRGIAYAQQQNGCFTTEYSALSGDVDEHISWATEALGSLPEAVNLWIGNHMSQTSFHKDHYENLYAVVSGQKHFLLLPPTDFHRMYVREFPAARYVRCEEIDDYKIELDSPLCYVPWPSVEPYPSPREAEKTRELFPKYFNGPKPFKCSIQAGEMLYLPSMWFHHVRQTPGPEGCTIAINYWYDMLFDIKYAYYSFLESLDLLT